MAASSWHDAKLPGDLEPLLSLLGSLCLVTLPGTATFSTSSSTASPAQACTGLSEARPRRGRGCASRDRRASPGLKGQTGPSRMTCVPRGAAPARWCHPGVGLKDNSVGRKSSPLLALGARPVVGSAQALLAPLPDASASPFTPLLPGRLSSDAPAPLPPLRCQQPPLCGQVSKSCFFFFKFGCGRSQLQHVGGLFSCGMQDLVP